jgi:hypothetical protein
MHCHPMRHPPMHRLFAALQSRRTEPQRAPHRRALE